MKVADIKIQNLTLSPNPEQIEGFVVPSVFYVTFSGTLEDGSTCRWSREFKTLDEDMELKTIVAGFLSSVMHHLYPNAAE